MLLRRPVRWLWVLIGAYAGAGLGWVWLAPFEAMATVTVELSNGSCDGVGPFLDFVWRSPSRGEFASPVRRIAGPRPGCGAVQVTALAQDPVQAIKDAARRAEGFGGIIHALAPLDRRFHTSYSETSIEVGRRWWTWIGVSLLGAIAAFAIANFRISWRRATSALVWTFLGAAVGDAAFLLWPAKYQSNAMLELHPLDGNCEGARQAVDRAIEKLKAESPGTSLRRLPSERFVPGCDLIAIACTVDAPAASQICSLNLADKVIGEVARYYGSLGYRNSCPGSVGGVIIDCTYDQGIDYQAYPSLPRRSTLSFWPFPAMGILLAWAVRLLK